MDPKLFPAFINEAMTLLPDIRGAILVYSQHGNSEADLDTPLRHVHSISNAASMLGLTEISEIVQCIEAEISLLLLSEDLPSDEGVRSALDLLAKFEATLLKISLDDENFSLNIDDFVDESFDLLQVRAAAKSNADAETDDLFGFDIDDELLDIFAMEAEGLLKNMETSLALLANNPNDRDSLWEIRRNAHTFKGAAGIVGLKQPSELAHRVEDMLDRLVESKSAANDRIFEILLTATDCLKSLTSGENSTQLIKRISQLYFDFDEVVMWIDDPSLAAAAEPVLSSPAAVKQPAASIFKYDAPEGLSFESRETKPLQPRSIVRVSLSRLDDLVRIVRDMIVSRSAFEQRLTDFERQIDELHNATRRLQSTSSKLEIDFEASMLGSDHPSLMSGAMLNRQTGFDELEFDQYTEFHESTRELAETTSDTFAINTALDVLRGNFESLFDQQRRLVEEMQEKLMRIRMVEFGTLATRLQRAVRVTCEDEDKKAQVYIENENLEIDTQILDSLIEPLMHLLKNAVVHGIEPPDTRRLLGKPEIGRIELSIVNEETHIVLTVRDDGRGITTSALKDKAVSMGLIDSSEVEILNDDETLNLIFLPGLTTAGKLNLSAGRGVGMSIVKESIEAKKGTIAIESTPQKGTLFTIRMPLTLAVTNVLLVKAGRQTYALPLKQVKHIGEIQEENVKTDGTTEYLEIAGSRFTLERLEEYLGLPADPNADRSRLNSVIIEAADRTYALAVDDILKSEEVVIKSLGRPLESLKGILGAAILGSGELVTILDLPMLLKNRIKRENTETPFEIIVMVVDDSPSVRHMTSKMIENAGWKVTTAKDGVDALEQLKAARVLPSIILTDIEMPRMDGYELAASLQRSEQFNSIPVVVITSRSADKHREKASDSGVAEYLTKPFDDKELINTIKICANVTEQSYR